MTKFLKAQFNGLKIINNHVNENTVEYGVRQNSLPDHMQ
jgi:hypothetical protein